MGLAGITLLGVNRDGGSHILHSLFLRSGWALQTQPEVVWVPRGAPSGGTPLNYRWPPLGNCALLAPCTGMTTGYIWRDSPLWLGDDAMREGNQKRRGAKPLFLGTHLPSARCRLSPLLFGREHQGVFQITLSLSGRSRALVRGGSRLASVCLHGRHKGLICSASPYRLLLLVARAGGGSVSSGV